MARSHNETADLRCPTCGQPFTAEVWLVVDRGERPDLARLIMDGDLNVARCPHCGAEGGVNHPLLFHDSAREQVLVALPLTVQGPDAARELVGDLLRRLLDALPDDERRPYLGEIELVPELDGLRAFLIEQALAEDASAQDHLTAIAVQDLLNVGHERDFQRVIAEHRGLLLTDRAEDALDQIFKAARRSQDRELQRRAQEAKAVLSSMRSIVIHRRSTLNALLDDLAPLSDEEIAVLPQLKRMLEAIDPQEVYAARITLTPEQQAIVDRLIERLAERAGQEREMEALTFLRNLALLPQQ
ncbi:MAG TPA: CpXC domain-containing protein [Herpetosiphonaceae bacterium]